MSSQLMRRQAVIDLAKSWRGPIAFRALPPMKQRIGIEALLRWAYCQELPKVPRIASSPDGFRCAWNSVGRWARELSLAGLCDNQHGVVPDFLAQDMPHNDALLVHEAVCGLDVLEVEGLEGFSPFEPREDVDPSLLDHCAVRVRNRVMTIDDEGKPRLRKPLRNLVFHAAILGGAPDWQIEDFAQDVERWPNGMVKYFKKSGHWEKTAANEDIFVEYETAVTSDLRRKQADPSVAPKAILTPDPVDDAVSRVNYELWRLALDVIAADLHGRLEKWEAVESALPHRPWDEPASRPGRVLADLTQRPIRIVRGRKKKTARIA
jgi:hypothetical protein